MNGIRQAYFGLQNNVLEEIQALLDARDKTKNYLPNDNDIFRPFIDIYISSILVTPLDSLAKEIGRLIMHDIIYPYELENNIKINKEQVYFAFAMLSIRMNDEINSIVYWELANRETQHVNGTTVSQNYLVEELRNKFTTVYKSINDAYTNNHFISKHSSGFIMPFDTLIDSVVNIDKLHLLSNAIRNSKIQLWLRNYSTMESIRMYSQELVNSLSILGESIFKQIPTITGGTLGNVLKSAPFRANNPTLFTLINDLFILYPTSNITTFNIHFPSLLASIDSSSLSQDDLKAHVIYGLYMIRNQSLHQFSDNFSYYNSKDDFENTIGLLFSSISAIISI